MAQTYTFSIYKKSVPLTGRGKKEFFGYLDCGTSVISEVGDHPHARMLQAEMLSQLQQVDGPNPDRPVGGEGEYFEAHLDSTRSLNN